MGGDIGDETNTAFRRFIHIRMMGVEFGFEERKRVRCHTIGENNGVVVTAVTTVHEGISVAWRREGEGAPVTR